MNYLKPALYGIAATLLASIIAIKYFSGHETMAICAFIAIGLGSFMDEILSFNRDAIWGGKLLPRVANNKLALEITSICLGIFIAALTLYISAGYFDKTDFSELYKNNFKELFLYNLKVLVISSIIAFLYRASGIVLILSWNAINWAEAIAQYLSLTSTTAGFEWSAFLAVALLPHLISEALSYILGGMAGLFLSKAVFKYKLNSQEFNQVYKACIKLYCISLLVLLIAVLLEINLAQPIFHWVRSIS